MITLSVGERLSAQEQSCRAECERVIAEHIVSVFLFGRALEAMRDGRLYRDTHATWEDYCQEKCTFGKRRADQLIASCRTVRAIALAAQMGTLGSHSLLLPHSEKQTRPMERLPVQMRPDVWSEATQGHGNQPSQAEIERIVAKAERGLAPADLGKLRPADAARALNAREAALVRQAPAYLHGERNRDRLLRVEKLGQKMREELVAAAQREAEEALDVCLGLARAGMT